MAQKVTISNEKNWTKTGLKILCNHFIVSSVVLILYFLKNIFNRLMNKKSAPSGHISLLVIQKSKLPGYPLDHPSDACNQ